MKILWVSTSPMGPASRILNMPQPGSSGGWIQSEYESLLEHRAEQNELYFLCASRTVPSGTIVRAESEEGKAFCINLPPISFGIEPSKKLLNNIKAVLDEVRPDLIHLWGTESCISYGVAKMSENIKKVVFIQGLIGMHYRYMGGYLQRSAENKPYFKGISLKKRLMSALRKQFYKKQIEKEQYILRSCGNAIIDNVFSEAFCKTVSPEIVCHHRFLKANRLFASYKWDYESCDKETIFTVFGQSADKGMHQLLKALATVKKTHPHVKLLIPGPFNAENGKLKPEKALSDAEIWMSRYIKANQLEKQVFFIGKLSPSEMAEQLQKCNLFVNPSCMEVHALSLREAMTVGVPCISSLCGSVIEYVQHEINGLIYRYEEQEMLAHYINCILEDALLAKKLSSNAAESMNYHFNQPSDDLLEIYRTILR